ncbi:MAG: hypothetical protein HY782_21980 [Chloroflexi bacterium]|nr:hypothetical protein [Chloroflexota bacterium]
MQLNPEVLWAAFAKYNLTIWPLQVVAYVLIIAALFVAAKKVKHSDRIVAAILAFFWLWLGIMFWMPFAQMFAPAYALAALCVIQGVLFLIGIARPSMSYRIGTDVFSVTGLALVMYATIFYPLVGYAVGHIYPRAMLVGVFPCPTTVVTFGLFLCTEKKLPKYLLVVPFLFALLGILWASRGIVEDVGLVIAGILATAMIMYRDRKVMLVTAPRPA